MQKIDTLRRSFSFSKKEERKERERERKRERERERKREREKEREKKRENEQEKERRHLEFSKKLVFYLLIRQQKRQQRACTTIFSELIAKREKNVRLSFERASENNPFGKFSFFATHTKRYFSFCRPSERTMSWRQSQTTINNNTPSWLTELKCFSRERGREREKNKSDTIKLFF